MRIAVVGDICLDVDPRAWREAPLPDLHRAFGSDVVIGNFESVIGADREGASRASKVVLSAPPETVGRLREMGVDYVSVANNHILDYGARAARETVGALESVLGEGRVFGHRSRPSAALAHGLEVLGACFPETNPVIGGSEWGPFPGEEAVGAVELIARRGARVLVFAHWGEEQLSLASSGQRRRVRQLIRAGAGHVVGTHAHVAGAGERLDDAGERNRGATAIYALGNFVFPVMPRGNRRGLASNRRSVAAVYDWSGDALSYVGWHECRLGADLGISVSSRRDGFPGRAASRWQLRLPDEAADRVYRWALATRGLRVGAKKVLTGVERPSLHKFRTARRLVSNTVAELRGRASGDPRS